MHEILESISEGNGTLDQLDLLEELAQVVKDTTMCGLGQTAPNPVLSTMRYFREEYLEHIERKRCPAGVCKELIQYSINENCTGCQACVRVCPADAIEGDRSIAHSINASICIKCGACADVCKFDAVEVV
jgi:ferredoxin